MFYASEKPVYVLLFSQADYVSAEKKSLDIAVGIRNPVCKHQEIDKIIAQHLGKKVLRDQEVSFRFIA